MRNTSLAEALTQEPTALETLNSALNNTRFPLNQVTEGIAHPSSSLPIESYRMTFLDTSQYNNQPLTIRDDSARERVRFDANGNPVWFDWNAYNQHQRFRQQQENELMYRQIEPSQRQPYDQNLTMERLREMMSNLPQGNNNYTVYTGSAGMRAFDEAMRTELGRKTRRSPGSIVTSTYYKYKIPSFYEQSHTDEHYVYVFKDIVTKRQLLGDTMNQAVVFATAEMEADNELVTKCKLYE